MGDPLVPGTTSGQQWAQHQGLGSPGYTLRLPSCAWLPEGAAQTVNLIWEEIDGGGTQVASVWSGEEIEHEIAGN